MGEAAAGAGGPSGAASRLGGIERVRRAAQDPEFDWEWGNEGAHRLVHAILGEIAPRFGTPERPAKIKEVPDDENIDLRGTYRGVPVRFAVWMSFGSFWAIELRAPPLAAAATGGWPFCLMRDLEKIPKHGDADDPWAEDEGLRIFVGRGIFFEGDEAGVQRSLAIWSQVPPAQQEAILAGMAAVDASCLTHTGDRTLLSQSPGLPQLDDPGAYFAACAALLAEFSAALEPMGGVGVDPAASAVAPMVPPVRITCGYCGTLYLLGASHSNCPNCGAPPEVASA